LGDYKHSAPLSLISQARQKQGQASPDIVALKGVRYAMMTEPSKGDKINDGSMKELTSCIEPISGRNLFSTPVTFVPQFKIIVCSNIFMEVKNNDHATWRRIRIIDFMSQFTDNPVVGDPDKPYQYKKNATLVERLPAWKEVFMAMLVRIVLRTQGFVKDCPIVMESSLKYREREDYLSQFVRDKVNIDKLGSGKIKKDELNQTFKLWYESNIGGKDGAVKIKELHEYMDRILGKFKMGTSGGCWNGASIRYDRSEPEVLENEIDDSDVNNIDISDM
jgi:phage/plasmid-associated DNA primase